MADEEIPKEEEIKYGLVNSIDEFLPEPEEETEEEEIPDFDEDED